jgi:hypothetical protein
MELRKYKPGLVGGYMPTKGPETLKMESSQPPVESPQEQAGDASQPAVGRPGIVIIGCIRKGTGQEGYKPGTMGNYWLLEELRAKEDASQPLRLGLEEQAGDASQRPRGNPQEQAGDASQTSGVSLEQAAAASTLKNFFRARTG